MQGQFYQRLTAMTDAGEPFVVATVIRVRGSASAKPGSKAIIDRRGRNLFGWVGGGCAESLVRDESLQALEDRQCRVVAVDLDDEVLGVGMPCGGAMDVYIEPHFPPRRLLIVGHNKLARHLNLLAQLAGYSVTMHGAEAEAQHFPGVEQLVAAPWDAVQVPPDARVVITAPHEGQLDVLRAAVRAQPGYLAFVGRRRVLDGLRERLEREGLSFAGLAGLRNPAGLDLGGDTVEEISLSIVGELLAWERGTTAASLRSVRRGVPAGGEALPPTLPAGEAPHLLVVGHGRLSEELARLGALLGWPVTVNAVEADAGDYPPPTCMVLGDVDFSRMEVTPRTHVVIATLHKGDHLSMVRALEGRAAYVGLIASPKRSGLVLDFLRERGWTEERMGHVYAPAGLDLGARNPAEIALAIACEIVRTCRGGSGAMLSVTMPQAPEGRGETCREAFE